MQREDHTQQAVSMLVSGPTVHDPETHDVTPECAAATVHDTAGTKSSRRATTISSHTVVRASTRLAER
jgi:hypothetical protein